MQKRIETINKIKAPLETVWAHISKGSDVNEWLPFIESCSLVGEGVGAKRLCGSAEGSLKETILKIDHESKIFQYGITEQPFFPIENIIGTMQLQEKEGYTNLRWDIEFFMEKEDGFSEVKEAIENMYAIGAQGLEAISN